MVSRTTISWETVSTDAKVVGPSLKKRISSRSDLKAVTYSLIGWWLVDILLFFFWIVPLGVALFIAACGLISATCLKMLKGWWSDTPTEGPWASKKETP